MARNNRIRAKNVRRKKVANIAAFSRQYTVNNCTIPDGKQAKVYDNGNGEWKIPKDGFPQPKLLRKKYKKVYYNKGSHTVRKVITHASDYDQFPIHVFHPKGIAWYQEQLVIHKTEKWERKNPCPVKPKQNPPDMFEEEYVVPWKAKREQAIERFRDFVVSIYDKLPLTGRFQKSDNEYKEEPVAKIKDVNMEGHKINDLNPKKSKLLKVAQKVTNETKAKRKNLVCTNLKDHKRQKGRIILPQAA